MSRALSLVLTAALTWWVAGCGGALQPVDLASGDACSGCRMTISDRRTAAQIVSPSEDARLFDDLGCLRDYLADHRLPHDARVYVADHRTGEWVDASTAVFARVASVDTPMGSHVVAWRDQASRDGDAAAADAELLDRASLLHHSDRGPR
jgi:copper chaperone NosL